MPWFPDEGRVPHISDFLSRFVGSANFHAPFLIRKSAHAVLTRASSQKIEDVGHPALAREQEAVPLLGPYSPRNASIGCTPAARLAGSAAASRATTPSTAVVVPSTSRFHSLTP